MKKKNSPFDEIQPLAEIRIRLYKTEHIAVDVTGLGIDVMAAFAVALIVNPELKEICEDALEAAGGLTKEQIIRKEDLPN